ncbi:shikimate dehydrogenase [Candidatus Enterococcus ferrettii]|uniref:Shikimate dehydrogenase (NADP(+)) n=1 Tax=Candidatus Enterococcus ferrettii TaxID=2815324 RepID=A0ABV0EMK2_9ENTE|nr:shikimate dehydrogenase [Enterococcus sp. 665A]MBO1339684.1 shikimate dehydrogenase [Enterococcus sp. 665A]
MKKAISGQTRLAGLYALPARHSFSPTMHTTSFRELGIDAVYLSFDVQPETLGRSIQAIRDLEMLGINLSMPHKMAAIDHVDELSQAARLIGAINTIVNQEGKLIGHTTDGIGCLESLREHNLTVEDQKLTILGAGGAATAIITQAAIDGAKAIDVFNICDSFYQTIEPKLALIEKETGCRLNLYDLADEAQLSRSLAESQLLINATNVGMDPDPDQLPIPNTEVLRADLPVFDVIYHPAQTKLLKAAEEKGAIAINGLGMLLHQGAAAFKLWTGEEMPIKVIRPLLEAEIRK